MISNEIALCTLCERCDKILSGRLLITTDQQLYCMCKCNT